MNKFLRPKEILSFILIFFLLTVQIKAQTQSERPSLSAHGVIYPNSCNEDQQKTLRSTLMQSSAVAPANAWRIVETFLCSERNAQNINNALTFTRTLIRQNYEETGAKPHFELTKSKKDIVRSLMANGNVWDAEIQASTDKLKVNYLKDAACIEGLIFKFSSGQWHLSESSTACD